MDMFLLRQPQCCVATKKLAGCLTSLRDSQLLLQISGVLIEHVCQDMHSFPCTNRVSHNGATGIMRTSPTQPNIPGQRSEKKELSQS